MRVPRSYALLGPAYLAALLAVDTQVGAARAGLARARDLRRARRCARAAGAARARAWRSASSLFATVGEVTGSLVWGVYRYRLHNLPLFIPPAHGIVYLSGLALVGVGASAAARRRRGRRRGSRGVSPG